LRETNAIDVYCAYIGSLIAKIDHSVVLFRAGRPRFLQERHYVTFGSLLWQIRPSVILV